MPDNLLWSAVAAAILAAASVVVAVTAAGGSTAAICLGLAGLTLAVLTPKG